MTQQLEDMIGQHALDKDGNKIGKIGQVYLDDRSGEPQWVTVSTGLFGKKESFAPLYGANVDGDDLRLAVDKDLVKDAPNIDDDGHLTEHEVSDLYAYYAAHLGTESGAQSGVSERDSDRDGARDSDRDGGGHDHLEAQGHDTSGPNTDDAMTRSEERVDVGTERVETGQARLRKYVVTENVTKTVPVTHEEVRVEREPVTDANAGAATGGPAISEEEHEVTLHAERPVVQKETVPVERVRLGTEEVTEEQDVTETVRKEQIDTPETDEAGR